MRDVYIVECLRSPLGKGKNNGALHNVRPVDLLAEVLSSVTKKAKLDPKYIEDVVCGVVTPVNQQGGNLGRLGPLKAKFPLTVPGVQLNRMCGSGQQAIHFVAQAIASGDIDIGIGCGVEMMSVEQMGADFPPSAFMKLMSDFPYQLVPQGQSAEKIGDKYGVTREQCDKFAYDSHHKAGLARDKGFFDHQITTIKVKDPKNKDVVNEVKDDEGIRFPPDMESLTKLKSVFKKNGVVTAGNASQITDGAGAVLLASADAVKKHNLRVRARILSRVCVGSDPILMLDGVIPATQNAVKKANLKLDDIDLFEINEAFAVVVCAWQKTLGVPNEKINVCGGACAHGHPLGATGAILMTKLVNDLERENKKYGLQTMCIGWGMATATVIERCDKVLPPRVVSKL